MWLHLVADQLAVFVGDAFDGAVEFGRGARAGARVLVGDALEGFGESGPVHLGGAFDRPLVGAIAEDRVVGGVGLAPDLRRPLGGRARLLSEAWLLLRRGR